MAKHICFHKAIFSYLSGFFLFSERRNFLKLDTCNYIYVQQNSRRFLRQVSWNSSVFNPLAPEFPFKFQHTLYLKCE